MFYNLTRELAKKGHNVTAFTSNRISLTSNRCIDAAKLDINGVEVHYLSTFLAHHATIITPGIVNLLWDNINNYDVVHIHDARSFQGITAAIIAILRGVPYVYQPHGSYLSKEPTQLLRKILRRVLDRFLIDGIVRRASMILALNQTESNLFRKKLGISKNRIRVLPNGIDMNKIRELPQKGLFRKKYGIEPERKIILYLGRLHESKGVKLLLRSYAYLVNNFGLENAVLVLVGPDDGFLNEAIKIRDALGVTNSVIFTGYVDESEKLTALVDSRVFVTPAFTGFPITFLESCIAGVPIVTTTIGDRLVWIHDNVGFVAKPTVEHLSRALYRIMENDDYHKRLSSNCRIIVSSEFTATQVAERLEKIYIEVCNSFKTQNENCSLE